MPARLWFILTCLALALAGCGGTKVLRQTRVITQTITLHAAPTPVVYTELYDGELEYMPTLMPYYGGHQIITRIHWVSYGGPTATGHGEWAQDNCTPSCAQGRYRYIPVTITLSTRKLCKGAMAYAYWTIRGVRFPKSVVFPMALLDDAFRSGALASC